MTVDAKDKKTKAKNPRTDSVASSVTKQNKSETERTILFEGIAPPSNTGNK